MKKLLENKVIVLLTVLGLGVLFGWILKPSGTESNEEHSHDSLEGSLWTCSMHPQISLSEPGDCPICGMDLIPSTQGSLSGENPLVLKMTPEALALAQVQTTVLGGVSSGKELILNGKLQADERQSASLTAKFPGRIEKLFVTFTGEKVSQGQKIATLYSPELLTAQKELVEAAKTKASFPQLYQASKEKLRLWKLTESQIEEIEKSGKAKDRMDIFADQSGVVTQKNVSVGDYVGAGSVLFTVTNLNSLWLLLDVYESDLPFVAVGNMVQFNVAGRPGQTYTAKITFIDPLINSSTRATRIRAEIPNGNEQLKPEMFVSAKLTSSASSLGSSELSIPRTSILWSGKRSIVYVKRPNTSMPEFEMREVSLGNRLGENYLIASGLQAGEEIVTYGAFALDASAQLAGKPSLLNRPNSAVLPVSEAFTLQVSPLLEAYFQVKNALVKDDYRSAINLSKTITQALSKISESPGSATQNQQWETIKKDIQAAERQLSAAKDISSVRTHFSSLSTPMLSLVENFGAGQEEVYKDFCPMAFGNKGGYWLSEVKEIANPYFGASMLTCGEVKNVYLKFQ